MKNEIFKTKLKINYISILKYTLFFFILFVFWRAGIKNIIFPFAVGFYIALIWCNQSFFILSAEFLLTGFLSSFSTETLIFSIGIVGFMGLAFLLHKSFKQPIKVFNLSLYTLASQFMLFYYNYHTAEKLISAIVSVFVAFVFMLACIKIFKALLVRGMSLKLNIDEVISLGLILCAFSLGLSTIKVFNFELSKIFSVFIILFCTYVFENNSSVIVGTILGLGQALQNSDLSMCAVYSLFALSSLVFKTKHSYFSVLSIIFLELVLGLYFNIYGEYSFFSLFSVMIGEALFLLLSKNTLSVFKIILGQKSRYQATQNIINRSQDNLSKKMFEISSIFNEMNVCFRKMVQGTLPVEQAKTMLSQEVMQKICADCPERYKCLRTQASETNKVFDTIISSGFERGKVTIIDIPPYLISRCGNVNVIISSINQLLNSYKQYSNMVNSLDASKLLIADQLSGISNLLNKLGYDTKKDIVFNTEKENEIIDELGFYNILVSEVVMMEYDNNTTSVTMLVREKNKDDEHIEKVLSKVCNEKMILTSSNVSQTMGFVLNEYKTAPKYDVIFGSAGAPKFQNKVSGDSYSFIKLGNDKVLFALCDGMGSGNNAQKTSETAMSLIENFYRAGFDNETIISSVNRFLTLKSDDNYSALDMCVIDLKDSTADFIKVGAPEGFIKHKDLVEIMPAGALPLGILDEMKPVLSSKLLNNNDMVVLTTDGVIDAFEGIDNLKKYINNLTTTNPQIMANTIIDEAMLLSKNEPKDDCTIICLRVFNRV